VRIAIGGVFAAALALMAFNALQVYSLNARNTELVGRAEAAESRARELRADAQRTRQTLNKEEVSIVQAASREANLLIDRRAFSWTDLFNRLEETLPADVRIVAVQPQVDEEGRLLVAMTAISRSVEQLNAFADRLEDTGAFRDMLLRQSDAEQEDGLERVIIQGYYQASPAGSAPPTSDASRGAAGNRSGNAPSAGPSAPGVER
jgi:hypothetical protein